MTTQIASLLIKEAWLKHMSVARAVRETSDLDTTILQEISMGRNQESIIANALRDATEEDWAFIESMEFTQHDEVYSICKDCMEVKLVYKMSYSNGEGRHYEIYNCLSCIYHNLIRRLSYMNNKWQMAFSATVLNYLCYPLIKQDEVDKATSDRQRCEVCLEYVMYPSDVIPDGLAIRFPRETRDRLTMSEDGESPKDPSKKLITHNKCSQKCGWGEHIVALLYTENGRNLFEGSVYRWRRNGNDLPYYQGKSICPSCFINDDEEFENKDDYDICGCDWIHNRDEMNWSDARDSALCDSCYSEPIECGDCGSEYYEDDSHECEEYSDDEPSNPWIHSYSYKPKPTFFGEGNCYLGIELEVEMKGADLETAAEYVWNKVGDRGYLKYDGSLQCGFEIVSHPHSLTEIQYQFPWKILSELVRMGVRSWDTRSCGIHVHISKKAFSDDAHQIRFTKLIYDNQRQVQRIAGRASNYASFSDKGNVIRKVKNHNQSEGRYSAVNVEPPQTIEVRVFKGSLRKERVLSALEFVHAVYIYTKNLKMVPKDKPLSWVKFVGFVSQNSQTYPNLFTIINESFDKDSITEQEEE